MEYLKDVSVNSPFGERMTDSTGSPVGVVRMDPDKSYAGIGELLQEYINHSSQEAWEKIRSKIDYTYKNLDLALSPLETETGFSREIKARLDKGQKLLFKPNLVNPLNINPRTHGPDRGSTTCTEWPFIAALMRWFHDKIGISYHQMSLGEAATVIPAVASLFSMFNPEGKTVTPEAVIEGKSGDFYGGWGFYFARKYLTDSLGPGARDDPMKGFEESVTGTYIPPGHVSDKLMVYDLNRIFDDLTKGRDVEVPDAVNFRSITLHKAVVGGAPDDPEDLRAYPGCILVNVPKLKVHNFTLFTNAIKNLGIGLYPMQFAKAGGHKWDYSVPHAPIPGMKGGIPHQVWVPELDLETGIPKRDNAGKYLVNKTGGITATMIDIIKAVRNQGIFMIHIVDAIEAINLDHTGSERGEKVPEGMVFAGLDPVATDLLCARYMFSNVPLKDALDVGLDDGMGGRFPQAVPIPTVEGNHIITKMGFDCPLARDRCFQNSQKRGLGETKYYVVGRDVVHDLPLASLEGHLGTVMDGSFSDLLTKTLYFDLLKFPWDMQQTAFNYLAAVDELAGSSLKREFLEEFDENEDGIVAYEEFGKKGITGSLMYFGGRMVSKMGTEPLGYLHGPFSSLTTILKLGDPLWNLHGHNQFKEFFFGSVCYVAFRMSQIELESPDPFLPGLTWGKGKWPSFQLARYVFLGMTLYGNQFPNKIVFPSLYATVFRYADMTQNEGRFVGDITTQPNPEALDRYVSMVSSEQETHLDFIFYVPNGYGQVGGLQVPNIQETDDPAKVLTASFNDGQELWVY